MNKNNRFIVFFHLFLFLFIYNLGYSQELQNPSKQNQHQSFASKVGGDVVFILSSPLRSNQKDGLKFLAITAITTALVTLFDEQIDKKFIERNDFYIKPAIGLAKMGDVYDKTSSQYVLAGLSASLLTGGLILKDKNLLETMRLMIEAAVIAGAITQIGKSISGRSRPYRDDGPLTFEWFEFSVKKEKRAFPSGHATSAFSMMTVLAKRFNSLWIKIPVYTVALSVALQRLESRNHWGSDVFLGGAIGYWVASALVNRYKAQTKSSFVNPYLSRNGLGIRFNF
jgi:membrane-associated phospholipid phosphatase